MPKTRESTRNTRDDKNTNSSVDAPSMSSQPPRPASSRRRASPFRGFGSVDQTELTRLTRVMLAESGEDGGSQEEASKEVSKEKRKRSSSPKNSKTKQRKTLKVPDLKSEKENSVDLFKKAQAKINFDKKKINGRTNKEKTVYTNEPSTDDAKCKGEKDFLGCGSKGGNFVNIFNNLQRGLVKPSVLDEIAEQVVVRSLRWFRVFVKQETTDLRVTAMAWHPSNAHLLVSGGKAGTLVLYKIDEEGTFNVLNQLKEFPGVGPGGTMENIRFNTKRSEVEVCTASVDGTIASYNFDTFIRKPLIESRDPYRVWFCAVDIHRDGKLVYGGDSVGNLAIHHLDSGKTDYGPKTRKLHVNKIRHLEFSPRDPNMFVTSSLDKTVKLWDIRKLDGKKSCIETLEVSMGISAAKFSRTDGCRLLTTGLQSELRVYKAPLWNLEHQIPHPHRPFQHLTVFRASWHPRADVFVVGRYPDRKLEIPFADVRSVDVYSVSSARLCHELTDTCKFITSLAEFNSTGSFLASSSGKTLYVWKERH